MEKQKSEQMVLELIYDHLIDNRIQNILWRSKNTVLDMVVITNEGSITIASLHVDDEKPETIAITSEVVRLLHEDPSNWLADMIKVPLTDPNSLDVLVEKLEWISNEYNTFAKKCELYGNALLAQISYNIEFKSHEFRRPLPKTIEDVTDAKSV